jgi:hypothetical protein
MITPEVGPIGMAMHGDISFVPDVLPIAPRPIAGELISSWLLRVSLQMALLWLS